MFNEMRPAFFDSCSPKTRTLLSVAGAVGLHVLVIAVAWPWIRPFVSSATSTSRKIDQKLIEAALKESPIISGDISADAPAIDEASYVSDRWTMTAAISPENARLPFSFAAAWATLPASPRVAPRRSLIATRAGGPTIRP